MRNTLYDLNNHLFAQLERLSDEDVKGSDLKEEIERAKAVSGVAVQIISNGNLALKGKYYQAEHGGLESGNGKKEFPPMLRADFLKE